MQNVCVCFVFLDAKYDVSQVIKLKRKEKKKQN